MDSPLPTLPELVKLSEPDPRLPTSQVTTPTLGETITSLGETSIDSEGLSSLVQEAATFPGNQTTFVNIDSEIASRHVSMSEELDAHIFNRRLLIRLYDTDHPSPESCSELKDVLWQTERHYLSFASGDDLKKLSHIRVLDHFLAGSVARRAVLAMADQARKPKSETTETKQRFDAMRATWSEPRFQSLDEYMNHQGGISEQILTGTVDINEPAQPVSGKPNTHIQIHANIHQRLPLPSDYRLYNARDHHIQVLRDMQSRTAKELVDISMQFRTLDLEDSHDGQDLRDQQTSSAQRLMVINSMISALEVSPAEQLTTPPTVRPTNPAENVQSLPRTTIRAPVTARRRGVFQNVNWQDVRPFHPTAPQQVTTSSELDVQQHIDSIVQAQALALPRTHHQKRRPQQTPLPQRQPQHSAGVGSATAREPGVSSRGFVGMFCSNPILNVSSIKE